MRIQIRIFLDCFTLLLLFPVGLIQTVVFFALIMMQQTAQATTVNWICSNSADNWSDISCWDSGAEPQAGDSAYLTHTAVSDIVVNYDSALSPTASLQRLVLDATGFEIDRTIVPSTINRGTMTLVHDTDRDLSASTQWIGLNANGTLIQSAGTNTASDLVIGVNAEVEASGRYELSGTGELTTVLEFVGNAGTGFFNQSGGTHSVSNILFIGTEAGSDGHFDLSGGTVTVWQELLGRDGTGNFTQTGGTHRAILLLSLGENSGGNGNYNLIAGDLAVTMDEIIGNAGTGNFIQTGGTHSVGNDLTLGNSAGSNGSYDMSAGELTVDRNEVIGNAGTGTFSQSGGTHNVMGDLTIGANAGVTGRYNLSVTGALSVAGSEFIGDAGTGNFIQSGGTHTVTTDLKLGNSSGGRGIYELHDGSLSVGRNITIGGLSNGTFVQTGGTHSVTGIMWIGTTSGTFSNYNLSGGDLFANTINVGSSGGAIFAQSGGTNTVAGTLRIGIFSSAGGSRYQLSGGHLLVNDLDVDFGGFTQFNQSGGTNTVANNLNFGNNPSSNGTYNLEGGTLDVGGAITTGLGDGELNLDGGTLIMSGSGIIDVPDFNIGSTAGKSGIHTLTSGTNTVMGNMNLGNQSGADGVVNLSGTGALSSFLVYVGKSGTGTFNHSGGTHDAAALTLGVYAGAQGSYNLSSTGELTVGSETIGSLGSGVFTQIGGTHNVTTLSVGGSSTGRYDMSGGVLSTTRETIGLGSGGNGIFTQTGGTHTVTGPSAAGDGLIIGRLAGGDGHYNLSGTGVLSAQFENVGERGSGYVNQSGGTNNVTNDLMLGVWTTGNGNYDLNGGELNVGQNLIIGREGTGAFVQSGGTNTVTSELRVGSKWINNSGMGSYELNGPGVLNANQLSVGRSGTGEFNQSNGTASVHSLTLGVNTGITGRYDLNAGNLSVVRRPSATGANETIGISGTGIFNQSGGTHSVDGTLTLGNSSTGVGHYNLTGGDLTVAKDLRIANAGTATFTQSGGTNTVSGTMIFAASVGGGSGTYHLQGGTLDVNAIEMNTGGAFNFTGGRLSVDSFTGNLNNNGGTLAPGNSPGATAIIGDYTQLIDGIFEVEIGGLLQGTEYDWLDVGGSATLGGTLEVSLFDLGTGIFEPSLGNTFDILTAESIVGEFDILTLALLGDGLKWDVDYILDDFGTDFVRLSVSQVPVPAAVWLFGSGLIGLIGVARRRKA